MNVPVSFFAETQLQFVWGRATVAARGIIFFLIVFSIVAWYMMLSKALQMLRAKKLNVYFESEFRAQKNVLGIFDRQLDVSGCPMFAVYQEGCVELDARLRADGSEGRRPFLTLKSMEHVKRTLESAVSRECLKLESGLILLAIAIGVVATFLPPGKSPRVELLMLHKSLGMTALVLAVLRVPYRLYAGAPPYGQTLAPLTRAAERLAHFALYVLMIAMPVAGYVDSAAGGHDVPWFGLFAWPLVAPQDKGISHIAAQAHYWLAWTIGVVLALHLAAVAWHLWVERDDVFARMWPARATLAGE